MSYTIYGPPRADGTQDVTTYDGSPQLRIVPVPVNTPQGGYSTQDHIKSYELPPDPAYDAIAAPVDPSGSVPTAVPLTPAQEVDKLRSDLATYRRNVSVLVDRGDDRGERSRERNAFYRTEERGRGMLYETPGLGIDIWQAIVTGVQSSAKEALKGASVSAPNLKLPAVGLNLPKLSLPIPDALKGISVKLPNIGLVAKSVSQKLEEQRRAEAAARQATAAPIAVVETSSMPFPPTAWLNSGAWKWILLAAAGGVAFAATRRSGGILSNPRRRRRRARRAA